MKRPIIYGGAIGAALLGSAILAAPASAWDELPCGATHETAHLCAPGEKARGGSTPNPAPVVVPPPAVVVPAPEPAPTPGPEPTPGPVVTTPGTPVPPSPAFTCARLPKGAGIIWRRKAGCAPPRPPVIDCATLRARKAGLLWFVKFSCEIPPRFRVPGPFGDTPVTG